MEISIVSIIYVVISLTMMVLGMHFSHLGFSAINEIVGTIIENFNMSKTIDSLNNARNEGGFSTLVFFLIFIHAFYVTRMVGRLSQDVEDSALNTIVISIGNTFFSCYLTFAYACVSREILSTLSKVFGLIVVVSIVLLLIGLLIVLFAKLGLTKALFAIGVFYCVTVVMAALNLKMVLPGMPTWMKIITNILLIIFAMMSLAFFLMNPITAGLVCAIVPLFLELLIFALLLDYIPFKNGVIITIATYTLSFPISLLIDRLTTSFMDESPYEGMALIIDIIFNVWTVVLTVIWIIIML